ncbi:hypothetical protein NliqN6_0510 [Naganishia liquefaciens]|uniref:Kinesin motor domain-containing protein n=1 Tax=Naganishia liquefaciens TaxID=104408 RepID=A0A8H3TNM9_9TREE|nr:hypothetical protein NliqN6_0510 [Naganishia liquefaciens]
MAAPPPAQGSNNIKVVCRFRPMNRMETDAQSDECIDIDSELTTVRLRGNGAEAAATGPERDGFTFDRVFPATSAQVEIFDFGVKGIVQDVMMGFNGTLFCYGQTGSGKTFTMMGADIEDPKLKGLIPRITQQIFASIAASDANVEYTVKVSYMEIYMEKIRDLLAPAHDNLSIHEDKTRGVYVKGLTDVYVGTEAEVYAVMKAGGKARAISATNMNAESSRSHSIFVVGIHQRNVETGSQKSGNLYLVDLAGSEKVGKTGASGQTLEEAKKINKSLSALGMVINNLTDGKSTHVPYRDSKLTRILQESLGGNSRTTLIINCSPASYNAAETLSTLRFGMRAKSIKNRARVNAEMSPAELKVMLAKCRGELAWCETYKDALVGEVSVWRTGGTVDEAEWATEERIRAGTGATGSAAQPTQKRPPSSLLSPSLTSSTPSRSASPSVPGTGRDTPSLPRLDLDEFLRRENELNDVIAEKESALAEKSRENEQLRRQLEGLQQRWDNSIQDRATINLELKDLKDGQVRLQVESRDARAALDAARDREFELSTELGSAKRQVEALERQLADAVADDREKKKAEMLEEMMAKIDTNEALPENATTTKLRQLVDSSSVDTLGQDQIRDMVRHHLAENQALLRGLQDRLRQTEGHLELYEQKREDLEAVLAQRNSAYEELLARQSSELVGTEVIAEIKASLKAQYESKQGLLEVETLALRRRLEGKEEELIRLQTTIDSQTASIEDLNRILVDSTDGVQNGHELVSMTQELERVRRTAETQHAEFEVMKRNLVRDITDRCEKVVELQIALDECKEKYRALAKATNAKAHEKEMKILAYNMSQMYEVQRSLENQNTTLKRDLNTSERKLAERKERIINLERLYEQSEAQRKLRESELARAHRDLHTATMYSDMAKENHMASGLGFGRIAKPLRGGGGNVIPNAGSNSNTFGGLPGATVSRLSDESTTGTPKRQSWFFGNSR